MQNIETAANLHGIDRTVGVGIVIIYDLKDTGLNAPHRLGRGRRLSSLHQIQRMPDIFSDLSWEFLESFSSVPDPPNGSDGYGFWFH
jgi:hypothetical protein